MDEEYKEKLRKEAIEIAKNDIVPNNYKELRKVIFPKEDKDEEYC